MELRIDEIVIKGVTYVPKGEILPIFKEMGSLKDMVGNSFYFRTVTYHIVGTVVQQISENIFKLENASWVADSDRFMNAIKEGKLKEVEPMGTWYVNLDTVTDFGPWKHILPTEQK